MKHTISNSAAFQLAKLGHIATSNVRGMWKTLRKPTRLNEFRQKTKETQEHPDFLRIPCKKLKPQGHGHSRLLGLTALGSCLLLFILFFPVFPKDFLFLHGIRLKMLVFLRLLKFCFVEVSRNHGFPRSSTFMPIGRGLREGFVHLLIPDSTQIGCGSWTSFSYHFHLPPSMPML